MFPCIPCLSPRGGAISDLTNNMKDMSLKAMKVHQRVMKQQKRKASSKGKEKEGSGRREKEINNGERETEASEWVAEEEPGVLITFVSLPLGGNRLKKIRFSEEYFDVWRSQRWWTDNCERIMSLYSVQQSKVPATPLQSDEESQISSSLESQAETTTHRRHYDNSTPTETGNAVHTGEPSLPSSDGGGGGGQGEDVDWVVEDHPGVFVTLRSSPDGSKELIRVELSRQYFGEVKARVWWEENKARLHQQYSSK